MNIPRRANKDLIKAMNRNLILSTIRHQGRISRTQLTEITGLSVGAISQITNDLLHDGWITEVGESDYTGGRRQVMLSLNPAVGYVVGLKLMEDRAVCAVTDLESTVIRHADTQIPAEHTPEAISAVLAALVENTLAAARVARANVFGVGVGLAGVIDCAAGLVRYSPFFQWRNVYLADMLSARLAVPVYLENDVNTLTVTEQLSGPGHNFASFAVVTVGRGIGMGMVVNHQTYQGIHGGVGELGHITIEVDGPPCACGKRGCLEALASDPAMARYIDQALANGTVSILRPAPTLIDIVRAAEQGDALAQEALARSGRYLGLGLATVVNILRPALIIISGEGVIAGDFRLRPMFDTMRQHTFNGLLEDVEILVKPTDDETWARGAAGLVVGKVFESPLIGQSESAHAR